MERDNIDISQVMVWVVLITYSFISFVVSFSHGGTLWWIKGKMNGTVVTAHVSLSIDAIRGLTLLLVLCFTLYGGFQVCGDFFWCKIQDFLEPFSKQTFLFQTQDYNLKQSVEASSSHDALQTYSKTVPCGYKGVLKLLILQ